MNEDAEWVSYSYGEMPTYAVFKQQIDASTPEAGGQDVTYPMELVDDDEITAVQTVLMNTPERDYEESWTRQGKFKVVIKGRRQLYKFLRELDRFSEEALDTDDAETQAQGEAVQNLISSILYTLNIEWI